MTDSDQPNAALAAGTAYGRTWLFVPGDRPERFTKAQASGADEVIIDLEDAVAPDRKDDARRDVAGWLARGGTAWVRINDVHRDSYERDVDALADLAGLRGIVVPKADDPVALHRLGWRLGGRGLIALIESALGVHRAHEIARCEAVDRLAFGSIDFAMDIDAEETDDSLLLARSSLVLASRAAEKLPPIDGVTTVLDDVAALTRAARRGRQLGFGGKLCVHPAQIAPIAAAFRPKPDELRWAERVLRAAEAANGAVTVAEGVMIDVPVVERARRILGQPVGGGRAADAAVS
jgi:citrate lyase subunit beta/citryl-CoA lyase